MQRNRVAFRYLPPRHGCYGIAVLIDNYLDNATLEGASEYVCDTFLRIPHSRNVWRSTLSRILGFKPSSEITSTGLPNSSSSRRN